MEFQVISSETRKYNSHPDFVDHWKLRFAYLCHITRKAMARQRYETFICFISRQIGYNNLVHSATDQTPFVAQLSSLILARCPPRCRSVRPVVVLAVKWSAAPRSCAGDDFDLSSFLDIQFWLSMANLKLACHSRKLAQRHIGQLKIKRKNNKVVFELVLHDSYKI